jgi:hypothetical protein
VRGHDPGPSSDLWALAATLYTAVEGRSPFRRTTPLTTMQAVVEEEAAELQHAGPLTPVIAALLRKDPATRPDASEAEQMLAEAAEGRRPSGAQAYVPTQYGGTPYRDVHSGTGTGTGTAGTGTGTAGTGFSGTGSTSHTRTPLPPLAGTPAPGMPTAGTPYGGTPTTGPTTVGPTAAGSQPSGPQQAGSGRRRRLRTLALVVALAAIIGGGTAVVLQQWNESRQTPGGASGSPSPTSTQQPGGSVPASWIRHDDPAGFSLSLPKGWKRKPFGPQGELKQIDYTPDGGRHFVRIAVDTSPDFADPYAHQLDLEQQIQALVDYKRVTLERNVYRDRGGALWEYTWTARAKDTPFPGPRRAIEETYVARDGTEYALYMSAPAQDWAKARKQFTSLLQGWQERTS